MARSLYDSVRDGLPRCGTLKQFHQIGLYCYYVIEMISGEEIPLHDTSNRVFRRREVNARVTIRPLI